MASGGPRLLAVLGTLCALVLGASAPAASAATRSGGLVTVLQDDALFLHRPDAQVRASLARLRSLGVDRLRVTANWSVVTRDADSPQRPANFDASDPAAYEQARWRDLDRIVRLAHEQGLGLMMDLAFWAPRWASADAPGERGRTDVDPAEYGAFAAAAAKRYSGTFTVPVDTAPVEPNQDAQLLDLLFGGSGSAEPLAPTSGPLPKVDLFTLWNEPNHTGFLRPQWVPDEDGKGFRPRSPDIYREMVRRAYPAIKAADPGARVLVGATSGGGSYADKGAGGVPPLRFLRELACVDARLRPLKTPGCRGFAPIPGDGWSHHPYSLQTTPAVKRSARRPDDVPIAELPRLVRTLDRLVRADRIAPAMRDVWVTEYGYESNPPSKLSPFGVEEQARFVTWGEYLAWRLPRVASFAQFLLRDLPPGTEKVGASVKRPYGEWYSGLEFSDGRPKPAIDAFRAGLFVERLSRGRLLVWGRLRLGPGARRIVVQVRRPGAARWATLRTAAPRARRAARGFAADGMGVVDQRARASRRPGTRYRLAYPDGTAVAFSPSVPAVTGR